MTKHNNKYLSSKAWLYKRRVTEGKTVEEMAEEAGVVSMSVRRALERYGIK